MSAIITAFFYYFIPRLLSYMLFAGLVYLVFWWKKNWLTEKFRIQKNDFNPAEIKRDILMSLSTIAVVSSMLLVVNIYRIDKILPYLYKYHLTHHAFIINIPWWSFLGWLLLVVCIHDTYFYWSHRLFHTKKLYLKVHVHHHLSRNPSPFSNIALHPVEPMVNTIWAIVVAATLPVPPCVWTYFGFVYSFVGVMGHSGIELFPNSWHNHFLIKYINSSTNHNHHHRVNKGNFGFYFTFWDRLMGTYRF